MGFGEVLGVLGDDVVGLGCQRTFVDTVIFLVLGEFQPAAGFDLDGSGFQQAADVGHAAFVEVPQALVFKHAVVFFDYGVGDVGPELVGNDLLENLGIGPKWGR